MRRQHPPTVAAKGVVQWDCQNGALEIPVSMTAYSLVGTDSVKIDSEFSPNSEASAAAQPGPLATVEHSRNLLIDRERVASSSVGSLHHSARQSPGMRQAD